MRLRIASLLLGFLLLPGFELQTSSSSFTADMPPASQPGDERAAQDALPMARDSLWDVLAQTKITIKDGYYASFPDAVKALDGQTVRVSGFMLPLEAEEKFTHFLLSKRTPTCFFCPPGEPYEVIEVFLDKPTEWIEDMAAYEGRFTLINNKDQGIFFRLDQASIKK